MKSKRRWKRFKFLLQSQNYEDLITNVERTTESLNRLSGMQTTPPGIPPPSGRLPDIGKYNMIRRHAERLYSILRNTYIINGCSCISPHSVDAGLRLDKPVLVSLEEDDVRLNVFLNMRALTAEGPSWNFEFQLIEMPACKQPSESSPSPGIEPGQAPTISRLIGGEVMAPKAGGIFRSLRKSNVRYPHRLEIPMYTKQDT